MLGLNRDYESLKSKYVEYSFLYSVHRIEEFSLDVVQVESQIEQDTTKRLGYSMLHLAIIGKLRIELDVQKDARTKDEVEDREDKNDVFSRNRSKQV